MKNLLFVLAFISLSCASYNIQRAVVVGEGDWVQYGNQPQRTNIAKYRVKPPLKLTWIYDAQAGIGNNTSVLVFDGILLVPTLGEEFYLVNVKNGKKIGSRGTESALSSTPVIYDEKIITASAYGKETVECFDLKTGKRIWYKKLGDVKASLLVVKDVLVVATMGGEVYAFNLKDPEAYMLWRFKVPKPVHSAPASDGRFVVFGCDDGNVYCVELKNGRLKWKFSTGSPVFSPIAIHKGSVFFGSLGGGFYSVDLKTGKLNWKFNAGSKIYGGSAVKDSMVVFGTSSGWLFAINTEDGKVIWKFKANANINSSPVISGDFVYFGSLDRFIYSVSLENGKLLWKYKTKGRIKSPPVVWKNMLFVASEDKFVYCFKPK